MKWPDPNASRADVDAFVEDRAKPIARPGAFVPFVCLACKHTHAGPNLAGICIGCPCPHVGGLAPASREEVP
jgi:hypothetical protein